MNRQQLMVIMHQMDSQNGNRLLQQHLANGHDDWGLQGLVAGVREKGVTRGEFREREEGHDFRFWNDKRKCR